MFLCFGLDLRTKSVDDKHLPLKNSRKLGKRRARNIKQPQLRLSWASDAVRFLQVLLEQQLAFMKTLGLITGVPWLNERTYVLGM